MKILNVKNLVWDPQRDMPEADGGSFPGESSVRPVDAIEDHPSKVACRLFAGHSSSLSSLGDAIQATGRRLAHHLGQHLNTDPSQSSPIITAVGLYERMTLTMIEHCTLRSENYISSLNEITKALLEDDQARRVESYASMTQSWKVLGQKQELELWQLSCRLNNHIEKWAAAEQDLRLSCQNVAHEVSDLRACGQEIQRQVSDARGEVEVIEDKYNESSGRLSSLENEVKYLDERQVDLTRRLQGLESKVSHTEKEMDGEVQSVRGYVLQAERVLSAEIDDVRNRLGNCLDDLHLVRLETTQGTADNETQGNLAMARLSHHEERMNRHESHMVELEFGLQSKLQRLSYCFQDLEQDFSRHRRDNFELRDEICRLRDSR